MIKFLKQLCAILTLLALWATNATANNESGDSNPKKIKIQSQIDRLDQGISKQQSKIKNTLKKEHSLYDELKNLDKLLLEKQNSNIRSQKKLLKQESFLQEKELELSFCREDKQRAEKHIKNRLEAFYKTGDISVINAIFSSSTLPDLLNTREYFNYLLENDKQTIKQYKNKLALLIGSRSEIMAGKEQLLKTIVDLKEHETELITVRQERQALLYKIQTEKQLYDQALKEMQEAASKIVKRLNEYKGTPVIRPKNQKKTRIKAKEINTSSQEKGFIDFKGRLPAPVKKGGLVSRYGFSKGVFGAPLQSNGIDISVTKETKVTSIYEGDTVYAGELEGYGNVVIISHGQQYFSLASRLTSILIRKGVRVQQGTPIGTITASQSGILQKGLHFEIRNGSTAEDPLLWLDKEQFSQ